MSVSRTVSEIFGVK